MTVIRKLYVMEEKEVEGIGILSLQLIKLQDMLNQEINELANPGR